MELFNSSNHIIDKDKSIILELKNEETCVFTIPNNIIVSLNMFIKVSDIYGSKIIFNVLDNSNLRLVINLLGSNTNIDFEYNLENNSTINVYSSEVVDGVNNINRTHNLNGVNSFINIYEYSLSSNSGILKSDFTMNHNSIKTKSNAKLMLIAKDNSSIFKSATSKIKDNMSESVTEENIRGLIMDEKSKIYSKPILVVNCSEVSASHGCALGTLDQNEIYYLMSRGLTKKDAIKIITHSFIAPILDNIKDEEYINLVKPILEGLYGE